MRGQSEFALQPIEPKTGRRMRVLCLTDFPMTPAGYRWIWNDLDQIDDDVDFLWAESSDRSAGLGKLVNRYPAFFRLANHALNRLARQPYDLVIAWEASIGIPFALAARWRRSAIPPFVLLAFNPGDVPGIFQPLIHLGMGTVTHCTVLTSTEAAAYARRYAVPPDRISVSPLPSYDLYGEVQRLAGAHPLGGKPYIHASGRSSRDYAMLVRAVAGLPVEAVIHGRGYNFQGLQIPSNVTIGDLASHDDFHRLVYHAMFEVVPIQPRLRPAGSSQVVFAMMMGKPVVATRNPSLADLVEDGVTGLLVEPGNVAAMRAAILYLLDHPEERARMGAAARLRFEQHHSFEQFAQRTHQLLQQVVQHSGDQA